jgi:hypothetical protein
MPLRDIEMMHRISHEIAILHDVGGRIHIQLKLQAPLLRVTPGLHAHFHDALADGGIVAERGRVPD